MTRHTARGAGAIPVDINQYHRIKKMGVVSEKGWHRSPLNILSNNQQGAFCTTIYDLETSFALWFHVEYNRLCFWGEASVSFTIRSSLHSSTLSFVLSPSPSLPTGRSSLPFLSLILPEVSSC